MSANPAFPTCILVTLAIEICKNSDIAGIVFMDIFTPKASWPFDSIRCNVSVPSEVIVLPNKQKHHSAYVINRPGVAEAVLQTPL